jgi:hypothetical protein
LETTSEIKLLTEKISCNELKPQEIGAKITTLFEKAQRELYSIEAAATMLTQLKL